jgi:hypothetical protein
VKLSELKPEDVTSVTKTQGTPSLKLSDLHPDDVTPVSKASENDDSDSELGQLFSHPVNYAKNRLQDAKDQLMGIGQGASLGFGDEILGAGQAAKDVAFGDGKLADIAKLYRQHQQENQQGFKEAKERSPWSVGGAEIAGGILPAALTMGGSTELQAALKAGKLMQASGLGAKAALTPGLIAGAGGSEGTLENNAGKIAIDSAFGGTMASLFGGAAPFVQKGAGTVLGKLAEAAKDSPAISKLLDAYKLKRDTGMQFTGTKGIKNSNDTVNAIIDDVTNKIAGTKGDLNNYYGGMLDDAVNVGDKLSTTDPQLMGAMNRAKNLILGNEGTPVQSGGSTSSVAHPGEMNPTTLNMGGDSISTKITPGRTITQGATPGRGGMTPETEALLQKYGNQVTDPVSLNKVMQTLNPKEAKTLENALREAAGKPGYRDTNAILDAANALRKGTSDAMTSEMLPTMNAKYSGGLSAIEPFINNGEVNKSLQKTSVGDLDDTQLRTKTSEYLSKVIDKLRDTNKQGGEEASTFGRVLQNADDINKSNQTQFIDTKTIKNKVDEAALLNTIQKSIYGQKAEGEIPGIVGKIGSLISGSPMRTALGAGGVARSTNKVMGGIANAAEATKLPALGRSLYQANDEALQSIAQTLRDAGHVDIANSLGDALNNKSTNTKNAALFTIMQNPKYRQEIFGNDIETPNQ